MDVRVVLSEGAGSPRHGMGAHRSVKGQAVLRVPLLPVCCLPVTAIKREVICIPC